MNRSNRNEIIFNYNFNEKEKEVCNASSLEVILYYLVNPSYLINSFVNS